MSEKNTIVEKCPKCRKEVEYIEFECDAPFTAPAELRFKALNVWGVYSAPKEAICQTSEFVHFKFLGNGSERLVKMLGFDREAFAENQEKLRNVKQTCQHTDENEKTVCQTMGNAVFSMFEPDEPLGYFCDEHCFENGACPGCYQFLAGWEWFEFSETGFCEECEQEFSNDDADNCDFGNDEYAD